MKPHQKQQSNRQQSVTVSSTFYQVIPRDNYTTPKDKIWGDIINHEKILEDQWKELWQNTVVPTNLRPTKHRICETSMKFCYLKPSPTVPIKASDAICRFYLEIVGWRSSDPENSMEFFNVQYKSDKKRFDREQFGYYRTQKYLQQSRQDPVSLPQTISLPGKYVKHSVKSLLC